MKHLVATIVFVIMPRFFIEAKLMLEVQFKHEKLRVLLWVGGILLQTT